LFIYETSREEESSNNTQATTPLRAAWSRGRRGVAGVERKKPGTRADLDLRGDDRKDACNTRVAPDGAVPERRVRDHRDGQEQRKNTAGDLRLAARLGRPVARAHRPAPVRASLGRAWPQAAQGCPHCASPAVTAGVVVRAARWSRAVSHGRAARRSKTASIAATRLRMPSRLRRLRELGPERTRARTHAPGAGRLANPPMRCEKTRELSCLDANSQDRGVRDAAHSAHTASSRTHSSSEPPHCST
jgi:hypothetical protein